MSATKAKDKATVFTGKKKKYYDLLMQARALFKNQLDFHSDEALKKNDTDQENKGMATHLADLGDSSLREMELQLMTEEGDVLQMIDEALGRLQTGEYGKCIDCGQPISEGRLEVRPYAIYCINCKRLRETNGGHNPKFN